MYNDDNLLKNICTNLNMDLSFRYIWYTFTRLVFFVITHLVQRVLFRRSHNAPLSLQLPQGLHPYPGCLFCWGQQKGGNSGIKLRHLHRIPSSHENNICNHRKEIIPWLYQTNRWMYAFEIMFTIYSGKKIL